MSEAANGGQQRPEDLPAEIPVAARKALEHPYRRQILRALQGKAGSLGPAELTGPGLVPCSLSCAGYHLKVLADCGLVAGLEPEPAGETASRRFSSLVGDDSPVVTVLRDTERSDRQRFELAA